MARITRDTVMERLADTNGWMPSEYLDALAQFEASERGTPERTRQANEILVIRAGINGYLAQEAAKLMVTNTTAPPFGLLLPTRSEGLRPLRDGDFAPVGSIPNDALGLALQATFRIGINSLAAENLQRTGVLGIVHAISATRSVWDLASEEEREVRPHLSRSELVDLTSYTQDDLLAGTNILFEEFSFGIYSIASLVQNAPLILENELTGDAGGNAELLTQSVINSTDLFTHPMRLSIPAANVVHRRFRARAKTMSVQRHDTEAQDSYRPDVYRYARTSDGGLRLETEEYLSDDFPPHDDGWGWPAKRAHETEVSARRGAGFRSHGGCPADEAVMLILGRAIQIARCSSLWNAPEHVCVVNARPGSVRDCTQVLASRITSRKNLN